MGLAEMMLTLSLGASVWEWNPETNKPQFCIPVVEEEVKEGDDVTTYCTQVPDVLLNKWIIENSTKV